MLGVLVMGGGGFSGFGFAWMAILVSLNFDRLQL